MSRDSQARLFHTLVIMGIGLTGGAVGSTTAGCGGTITSGPSQHDAAPDASYEAIHYTPPARDAGPGGEDAYATIGYLQPDASSDAVYPIIYPAPPPDAGDASYPTISRDASDAAYPIIQTPPPDGGDASYPTIEPNPSDAGH